MRCGFGCRLRGRQFRWRRCSISNRIGREEIGRRLLGRSASHAIIMPTSTLDGNQSLTDQVYHWNCDRCPQLGNGLSEPALGKRPYSERFQCCLTHSGKDEKGQQCCLIQVKDIRRFPFWNSQPCRSELLEGLRLLHARERTPSGNVGNPFPGDSSTFPQRARSYYLFDACIRRESC